MAHPTRAALAPPVTPRAILARAATPATPRGRATRAYPARAAPAPPVALVDLWLIGALEPQRRRDPQFIPGWADSESLTPPPVDVAPGERQKLPMRARPPPPHPARAARPPPRASAPCAPCPSPSWGTPPRRARSEGSCSGPACPNRTPTTSRPSAPPPPGVAAPRP